MILVFSTAAWLLAYTLAGYPALMWLASRWRSIPASERASSPPTVTLIIPAHNEELVLGAKLANTERLDYPKDKLAVIVVSDGSTDRTSQIAAEFADAGVQFLDLQPNRGKASALNAGVEQSAGELLCLCDANVMFHPDALTRMVARFADCGVGAVSGDVRLASEESDFEAGESGYYLIERRIHLGESRIGSMMGVDGGMYVLRRELYQSLPADTMLDDFATSMRVLRQGKRIVYEPRAIATENGTPTWQQEFQRRIRVTRGAVQSMRRGLWPLLTRPIEVWQYVSHKPLRWLGPIWLLLLLASSVWLWNAGWIFRAAFLAQIAFYGCAALGWISPGIRRGRVPGFAFYFTMSHIAMLIGLAKGVFIRPTGVWERTSRAPVPRAVSEAGLPEGALAAKATPGNVMHSVAAAPGAD